MKKRFLWAAWGLAPVAALAMHLGPGQTLMARDAAADHLSRARSAEKAGDWGAAADEYALAKAALPPDARVEKVTLAISEAKARIQNGDLLEGAESLEAIIEEEERGAATPDAAVLEQARHELGTARYYSAWLMRLEGAAPDEWKPESEAARQQFRLLAEEAQKRGEVGSAEDSKKNLEEVIRLEQMDLSELQGLPLPKNCPCNCKGLCQKKREQRLSKCKNPGKEDVRKDISKSAGKAAERGTGH
jgi:hypothetical protein